MKTIFFLVSIFILPFLLFAYADIELTNSLKNNIDQQFQNNLRTIPIPSILEELTRQDFLSNAILSNQFIISSDKKQIL